MSYEKDLATVKAEAMKDGVTRTQFAEWGYAPEQALKRCGFASASDVRRVADKFGHVNRW